MLEIKVDGTELFDENTNEFITINPQILKLEHSLVSISKWESKWHKAFLADNEKTREEIFDYIRCMEINKVDDVVLNSLSQDNLQEINDYINNPMTATTIKDMPGRRNNEVVTSELVYYWMVALQIPFECEKWHLNRLLTLIRVCNAKNEPAKRMPNREIYNQNRLLNAARRKRYHSKG